MNVESDLCCMNDYFVDSFFKEKISFLGDHL